MKRSKLKTILQEVKHHLIELYQDQLETIIVYGSQARGDATEYSDIDLLVVLKYKVNPYQEIDRNSKVISEICLNNDVVISCNFISAEKFNNEDTPFIYNVRREGIRI